MPNNLTDAEIKKALECCASVDDGCSIDCPLYGGDDSCFQTLLKPTLDLINRKTTRLRKVEHQLDDALKMYNTIKAEAYKECIEKAKSQCNKIPQYHFNLLNVELYLDNLLNELVGDEK